MGIHTFLWLCQEMKAYVVDFSDGAVRRDILLVATLVKHFISMALLSECTGVSDFVMVHHYHL